MEIRPTADRAREAIFSIIGSRIEAAAVLDLFAGTGAMGLEALSRGARSVVFVDNSRAALELMQKNIGLCGFSARSRVVKQDLAKGLSFLEALAPGPGFTLVFLDPPYRLRLGHRLLAELGRRPGLLAGAAWVIAEDEAAADLPPLAGILRLRDQRRYGDTGFWIYGIEIGPGPEDKEVN